ncbi:MAG: hypothetical protein QMD44_07605, partial [Thermodesulfovibrionales bacterium]|nr:hypothetical protein [Thermodesulfovibrionales bacterium]
MKKLVGFVLCALLLIMPCSLVAGDVTAKDSGSGTENKPSGSVAKGVNAIINSLKKPDDAPDWLKRINLKFEIQDDYKP